MGVAMFVQQKLNPAPPDPVQAKVMTILPIMFTFLLASFPVGLVIYWTWSNILTIGQQWVIKRGVERDYPELAKLNKKKKHAPAEDRKKDEPEEDKKKKGKKGKAEDKKKEWGGDRK